MVVREDHGVRTLQSMVWGWPVRLKGMKPDSKPKPVNNIADLRKPFWMGAARKPEWRCLIPLTRHDPAGLSLQHGRGHSVSVGAKMCAHVARSIKSAHIAYRISEALRPNRLRSLASLSMVGKLAHMPQPPQSPFTQRSMDGARGSSMAGFRPQAPEILGRCH